MAGDAFMDARTPDRITLARLRLEARDALELVLLPGLAALLPWRWCFALFRQLARCAWLYREPCARALAQAQAHGLVDDAGRWLRERRLVTLVDHADHYLTLARRRGDAWWPRQVQAAGQWAVAGEGALLVTFHWGCGLWAQRHGRAQGLWPHTLVASPRGLQGRWVLRRYIEARLRTLQWAEGRPVIHVPGPMRAVHRAWAAREQVVLVIDVPADQAGETAPVKVLGRTIGVPAGLVRLAVRQRLPVTLYTLGLDVRTGERQLRLEPLGVGDSAEVLLARIFERFEALLRERPAHWHLWSEAERFFAPAQPEAPC